MSGEMIFRLLTASIFVTALSTSIYFRHKAERRGGRLNKAEGQRLLIPLRLLGLLGLLPLFGYILYPDWVAWARFALPNWARWVAAAVAIGMIPAFYALFQAIGNNISPTEATRANHQLITSGPYRWIRHPLYTFGTIFVLALAVLTTLWWLALVFLPALLMLLWRVRYEEANLIARFGDEYRVYMQRTGRFLPKWGQLGQRTD
jgi:protein-S-isoprenylcysteine O-methyltransferase Ste14